MYELPMSPDRVLAAIEKKARTGVVEAAMEATRSKEPIG
jgi:hypothetical protein